MRLLKEQPTLKANEAIDQLMKLEDVGLVVDPPLSLDAGTGDQS
jgi:hypothetical protein